MKLQLKKLKKGDERVQKNKILKDFSQRKDMEIYYCNLVIMSTDNFGQDDLIYIGRWCDKDKHIKYSLVLKFNFIKKGGKK